MHPAALEAVKQIHRFPQITQILVVERDVEFLNYSTSLVIPNLGNLWKSVDLLQCTRKTSQAHRAMDPAFVSRTFAR